MIIKYLKLTNFKRFPLRDVEVFENEFTSKLIFITGPNGSGKSTLCSELTPLPSDKNNFYKNGYKEIHILKERKLYKLICDFREGSKFSFLIDDEEQNLSNNVTTQRELVFFHFNITQTIHDILIGTETFTNMSLGARKKLFSAITHLNIDKVLDNYNTLKEELKTNEFLLKTQTSLYQTEEQKLINPTHLDTIKETLNRTKKHIDFLLELRTELYQYKITSSIDDLCEKIKTIQDKVQILLDKYYVLIITYPKGNIESYKVKYSSELSVVTYQLNDLYSLLEKKQEELKILSLTKQSTLDNLVARKKTIEENIKSYTNSLQVIKDITAEISPLKSAIYKLEISLPDILRTLPTNEFINDKRYYTKSNYDSLLNDKSELLNNLSNQASREITLTKELQELSNTNDSVTCPNCTHTWSLKDIPMAIANLKKELNSVLENKIKIKKSLEENSKAIEAMNNYFTLYNQYNTLRHSTITYLKPLWDTIDQQQLIFSNPSGILSYLNIVSVDLNSIETVQSLNSELSTLDKNIEILSTLKDSSYQKVEKDIEDLIITIEDVQSYKNSITLKLQTIERVNALYTYLEKLKNLEEVTKMDLYKGNLSYTITDILNTLDTDLSMYKVILIENEKELHKYETIQYTLAKYKKTIEDTQSNIKVLNIILDELSPKNGLIAKSISSFLNIIISNINKTIMNIWNYKMELKPIDVEYDSLNYKFKVKVEDKLDINDINLCSAGMRKIINFSFVLLLYKLLQLEDAPLWLDEFTTNLDTEHSRNFATLINNIYKSSKHSQIFIISHINNDYYFSEKDIQVISLDN